MWWGIWYKGGTFDKGGEIEPEVLKFYSFSANTLFSDFEAKGHNFVKNWLKETGMEKLCASFEGMYYKIV
jgi:hypothetical protein